MRMILEISCISSHYPVHLQSFTDFGTRLLAVPPPDPPPIEQQRLSSQHTRPGIVQSGGIFSCGKGETVFLGPYYPIFPGSAVQKMSLPVQNIIDDTCTWIMRAMRH